MLKKKNVALIIAVIIFTIGIVFSYSSYSHNKLAKDMKNSSIWKFKKNGAKIIISDIEEKVEGWKKDFYRGNNNNSNELVSYNTRYYYKPLVAYRYKVDGKIYMGKNISYDSDAFIHDKLSVLVTLDKYKRGTRADLYYNFSDPNTSYLVAEEEQCSVIPTIITLMSFILAICIFYNSF